MSELHSKNQIDGLAPLASRKENVDSQYIKMQISITTTTSAHSVPITLNFSAPIAGTNVSIGDKWAAEISAEVKKAVASAFDSKYGRRSTMSFTGNYADAQQSMSRLDDVKEECDPKSHQSYGVLNKSWGESGDKKSSAGSKTALVVDDGAMCRKACGAMMQEMGFKVEYANDGKEAVDKIFREDTESGIIAVNYYEVVMMDNFMPNMDGSDAVTLLRLNGYTGTIIGLTYDIFDEPSKLFRESGCTTLLLKPLRLQLVKKALSKLGIDYVEK